MVSEGVGSVTGIEVLCSTGEDEVLESVTLVLGRGVRLGDVGTEVVVVVGKEVVEEGGGAAVVMAVVELGVEAMKMSLISNLLQPLSSAEFTPNTLTLECPW